MNQLSTGAFSGFYPAALVAVGLVRHRAVAKNEENAMLLLTETDNGQTVELRAGDTLRVSLPENATTGYRWAIESVDRDVLEESHPDPQYATGTVGAGGRVVFAFRAKKTGRSEIMLKTWRDFEGEASVQGRFRLRVHVVD